MNCEHEIIRRLKRIRRKLDKVKNDLDSFICGELRCEECPLGKTRCELLNEL